VTSAYNPGKYGISPINCQPKESKVNQKTQASRGVVIYEASAGPLFIRAISLIFGDK
jgi:hypothetical protein